MKKLELIILALILCWIVIWDIILYKVYNKIEDATTAITMENMYNKNDIVAEIQQLGRMIE